MKVAFWILPAPSDIFNSLFRNPSLMWYHLKPTIGAAGSGFIISIVLGVFVAIAMDTFRTFKEVIYPFMVVSQTVPIIAIAPLLIVWFGFGISSKIFTVILVCFFPISMNLYDGFQQVSIEHKRLLKSMGATNFQTFLHLKLPASLPSLFSGLKLAATYSVMGAIIGEWLGGSAGLGIYMTRATKSFQTAQVFAIILVIVLLSMSFFSIVIVLDRILLRWRYQHIEEYEEPGI